jgi:transposase
LVRAIAAPEHTDPFGRRVRVSRQTVDRWIRDWRAGGFDALVPHPRQSSARTPAEVMELAVGLRRENPDRTAAGIRRILRAQLGWSPDERTLQRHFTRLGLSRSAGTATAVFDQHLDRPPPGEDLQNFEGVLGHRMFEVVGPSAHDLVEPDQHGPEVLLRRPACQGTNLGLQRPNRSVGDDGVPLVRSFLPAPLDAEPQEVERLAHVPDPGLGR